MVKVLRTRDFIAWFDDLADERAQARIAQRIARLASGNPGDAKAVGGGIIELRVDYGPGYRLYYTRRGRTIVVLLCGGDKRTQSRDIRRAALLAAALEARDETQ